MFQHLAPGALFSLEGRVVFMTGGAGGIAAGPAQGFAAAGARLVLADRDEAVEARAEQLRAAGAEVSTRIFDITEAAVAEAIGRTRRDLGRLDVVVNNAAVIVRKHVLELSLEEWKRVLDVDVTACFSVAQQAARVITRAARSRYRRRAVHHRGEVARQHRKERVAPDRGPARLRREAAASRAIDHGRLGLRAEVAHRLRRIGAQLLLFTTGVGNPYVSALSPTIKLSANPETAAALADQLDFDASGVFRGHESLAEAGEALRRRVVAVAAADAIPLCHKISVSPIEAGQRVIKYGQSIGEALAAVGPGRHVHVHNLRSARARAAP